MHDTDDLTDKQRRYVQHVASGMESRQAAKAAGYSDSYAKVAAHRLKKKPSVAKALEAVRREGLQMAAFGLLEAMNEAESAATFARLHKNPMALVKATELRAKLSGLMIDRVEVACVDLKGALLEARTLVFGAIDVTRGHVSAVQVLTAVARIRHNGDEVFGD